MFFFFEQPETVTRQNLETITTSAPSLEPTHTINTIPTPLRLQDHIDLDEVQIQQTILRILESSSDSQEEPTPEPTPTSITPAYNHFLPENEWPTLDQAQAISKKSKHKKFSRVANLNRHPKWVVFPIRRL